MEFLKQLITRILGSGLLSTALVLVRAVTVLMVLYVIWRCYTSFKKGQRRKDPVVMLEDAATGAHFPVLYWENSIGRSRSCDIQIPDNSVSRDHAVLMRREEGWFVCDTGSHAGTRVRNKQITEPRSCRSATKSAWAPLRSHCATRPTCRRKSAACSPAFPKRRRPPLS
jgi:cell division protein FtsW